MGTLSDSTLTTVGSVGSLKIEVQSSTGAALAAEDLKPAPQPIQLKIFGLDASRNLYLNASGISCDTIATALNTGITNYSQTEAQAPPWYQRWWTNTKNAASSGGTILGATYADSVANFKQGNWAIGTGDAIGTTLGELLVATIELAKGIGKAGYRTYIVTKDTVLGVERAQTQTPTTSTGAGPTYQSFTIPTSLASGVFALPENQIATDGTIYVVPKDQLVGRDIWRISALDGISLTASKAKAATFSACQLGKGNTGKLVSSNTGSIKVVFGTASCSTIAECLSLVDKTIADLLFR